MSETCLSVCVKRRAHALVMLPLSRCGISAVITLNCFKEIEMNTFFFKEKAKSITLTDVGQKPSWTAENRSGEDRSTEISLHTGDIVMCYQCWVNHHQWCRFKKKKKILPNTHWVESKSSVLVLSCSKQLMKTCDKHTMWETNGSLAHLSLISQCFSA